GRTAGGRRPTAPVAGAGGTPGAGRSPADPAVLLREQAPRQTRSARLVQQRHERLLLTGFRPDSDQPAGLIPTSKHPPTDILATYPFEIMSPPRHIHRGPGAGRERCDAEDR